MATGLSQNPIPPDRRNFKPDDPEDESGGGSGESLGEYAEILDDDQDPEISQEEDEAGNLIVTIGEAYEPPVTDGGFYENLALVLSQTDLDDIGQRIVQKVTDEDKEAWKKRAELYEEGIKRSGAGKEAPGGADFEGATKVVHPGLLQAAIDYEARIMKELWTLQGIVKPNIVGTVTREKTERAARKVEHINWQLQTEIKEAFPTMEVLLGQIPLAGSQFLYQWFDHGLKRIRWAFVPADRAWYPYSAVDWHSATRRTISWTLAPIEIKKRMQSGHYRELELGTTAQRPDPTPPESATDKAVGRDDPGIGVDDDREIYETMEIIEVTASMADTLGGPEQEGDIRPYLVSIDIETRQVLSIYRDWEEEDETCEPIEHAYEFQFWPWRGGSIGLVQIIGSLSGSATGALRALLDSAHAANAMTAVVLKGAGVSGQTRRPNIGEMVEIESGLETDDIRKKVMMMDFKGPSPVLFQLLGFLDDAMRRAVRTSMDEVATDQQQNTPVGTQLSRIEQGMVVFSAIFGRAHKAFNRVVRGLMRLNRMYLPEKLSVDADGKEILVYRRDYEGPVDVDLISDPSIYSDQQRFGQVTAIQQRATQVPQMYKLREVEKRWLKLMKVNDPDEILADIPQPHELNQVNEVLAMILGRPTQVFPEQDHLAHLQVLLDAISSPVIGLNPLIAPTFLPLAIKHANEHIGYLYVKTTTDLIKAAAGRDAYELMSSDDKVKARFDQLLAVASQRVMPEIARVMEGAMPILQRAQQMLQQVQPPQPQDPSMAAFQASKLETDRKTQADQSKASIDQQTVALKAQQVQNDADRAQLEASTKIATTSADNQTAEDIASLRTARGQAPGFTDGASMRGS